ncbi:hypothetical protein [Acidocella facilis]|uniref:hypothetical protein n=1 Tax=Acidocella facilis TaxID=525 RepID=UPI001F338B97|nr:hypothetical protein [Acidocella facilis]
MIRKNLRKIAQKATTSEKKKLTISGKFMAFITAVGILGGLYFSAVDALKSSENMEIDVQRSFETKNIHLILNYPQPLIEDEWVVDIYNRSTDAIAIKTVSILGYSETNMISMVTVSPNESLNDEIEMPFTLGSGDVKRLVLHAVVPARIGSMDVFKKCFNNDFSEVQKCLAQQGVDELGNKKGIKNNAAVEVLVTDSFGHQYSARASWFPGEPLPGYDPSTTENK